MNSQYFMPVYDDILMQLCNVTILTILTILTYLTYLTYRAILPYLPLSFLPILYGCPLSPVSLSYESDFTSPPYDVYSCK